MQTDLYWFMYFDIDIVSVLSNYVNYIYNINKCIMRLDVAVNHLIIIALNMFTSSLMNTLLMS